MQLALFLASAALAAAANPLENREAGMRLIKTSERDLGTWMSQSEKMDLFGRQRGGWLDVTDASVGPSLDAECQS